MLLSVFVGNTSNTAYVPQIRIAAHGSVLSFISVLSVVTDDNIDSWQLVWRICSILAFVKPSLCLLYVQCTVLLLIVILVMSVLVMNWILVQVYHTLGAFTVIDYYLCLSFYLWLTYCTFWRPFCLWYFVKSVSFKSICCSCWNTVINFHFTDVKKWHFCVFMHLL